MAVSSVPFKPQPLNACQALQCDHVLLASLLPMQLHDPCNAMGVLIVLISTLCSLL